ncbi:KTSC domain-containing protein [Rhizobium sp. VS19-DR104.2]|uniref:KTSC domain-containing protein n=1 Tax=unclassified Rhizobium TaxID=2613769 RepID=UPI001C5BD21F|nr:MULTISPECIES: KTSC domain-containing protein [unclassified Rhizobium]MBZ5763433.1 KTSC domain-containing protein [Rhizobium sp. VS19-DR96]MBZ5769328.1 KTSC domain-containing protein [Rhizobium sp. VS19-DR129.2]MBZ5776898.1 KTSC domain-containing protein [Rhizobium sp. VS19-DRK62.2]MBZ5788013.1 KTSC domain-containing protein [Rhizobium sp. VS19-DR121]MBZ5805477.1 KTSC domain-containing protein [Rhizobium sp. VS19-DR181]
MKELSVSSRIIKSVFFSQTDGQLRISFKNGEERLFQDVPEQAAMAMVGSSSPGQHYLDNIRPQFKRVR